MDQPEEGRAGGPGNRTAEGAPAAQHLRVGRRAEELARRTLEAHGLRLLEANYRVARGRSRHGGEIDLILRDRDGTLVFVEVRARRDTAAGGAAASIGAAKRARLVYAAQVYLARLDRLPPCRFDVVAVDGDRVQWLRAAFDAG